MKKLFIIIIITISYATTSCSSSNDDNDSSDYPRTVNIKYEATTSRNTSAIITTTLDNNTETEDVENLPYSNTYSQTIVNNGTYVKLTYFENGSYAVGPDGSSWTDYTVELKIYENNEVIKSESFAITEGGSGVKLIDYTFD